MNSHVISMGKRVGILVGRREVGGGGLITSNTFLMLRSEPSLGTSHTLFKLRS